MVAVAGFANAGAVPFLFRPGGTNLVAVSHSTKTTNGTNSKELESSTRTRLQRLPASFRQMPFRHARQTTSHYLLKQQDQNPVIA